MNLKHIGKKLVYEISKNSPVILTSVAVSGTVATAIFAAKGHLKAQEVLSHRWNQEKKKNADFKDFSFKGVVCETWQCYIPAGICVGVTIGSVIALNSVHTRRNASLAAVYSITETAFKEYQSKVAETIGKNKEQAIRDDISHDHVQRNPPSVNEIFVTGGGNVRCLDRLSGRYFWSDYEKLRRIINDFNYRLMSEMYLSVNEFYDEIGLAPNQYGDDMGWSIDSGKIDITFSAQIADDGNPCLVLNYEVAPRFSHERW